MARRIVLEACSPSEASDADKDDDSLVECPLQIATNLMNYCAASGTRIIVRRARRTGV